MAHNLSTRPAGDERAARMPGWARALDERGRRIWPTQPAESRERSRRVGYIVAIVVNAILLVVARAIPTLGLPFVTPAFGDVLPAIERSLVATMIANAVFCVYDAGWFRHLAQAGLDAIALSATLVMRRVFPFDFGTPTGNDLARLALLLVIIALVIAIVVELIQSASAVFRQDREE